MTFTSTPSVTFTCAATLGAKSDRGYFSSICRYQGGHVGPHVFELRRFEGERITVAVNTDGEHVPPSVLDSVERDLAAMREIEQRRRDDFRATRGH